MKKTTKNNNNYGKSMPCNYCNGGGCLACNYTGNVIDNRKNIWVDVLDKPIKAKTLVKKIKDMNNKSGDCLGYDFKNLKVEYDIKVDTKNNDPIYTDKTLPDFEDGALDLPRKNKGFFYTCSDEQLKHDLQDKPVEIEKLEVGQFTNGVIMNTVIIEKVNELVEWINDHQNQHDLDD